MAAICSVYVIAATWLHSCTENWVVTYAKMGLTGKQLPCDTNLEACPPSAHRPMNSSATSASTQNPWRQFQNKFLNPRP